MLEDETDMILVRGFDPILVVEERLYAESAFPFLIEFEKLYMEWLMHDDDVIVHGVVKAEWFCVYYSYGAN